MQQHDLTGLKRDTTIGVVFTSLFALGLVLVSRTPSETHLTHILFGNVLGISQQDLLQTAGLGLATVAVLQLPTHLILRRAGVWHQLFSPRLPEESHVHAR